MTWREDDVRNRRTDERKSQSSKHAVPLRPAPPPPRRRCRSWRSPRCSCPRRRPSRSRTAASLPPGQCSEGGASDTSASPRGRRPSEGSAAAGPVAVLPAKAGQGGRCAALGRLSRFIPRRRRRRPRIDRPCGRPRLLEAFEAATSRCARPRRTSASTTRMVTASHSGSSRI